MMNCEEQTKSGRKGRLLKDRLVFVCCKIVKEQIYAVVKQVKHAEAAQLVMEPVTAAVMPIYPAKVILSLYNLSCQCYLLILLIKVGL